MLEHNRQLGGNQFPPVLPYADTDTGFHRQQSEQVLGNTRFQSALRSAPEPNVFELNIFSILQKKFAAATPTRRLELLKGQRFTLQERNERIRKALIALHTPSTLHLTQAQWRDAAESSDFEEEF